MPQIQPHHLTRALERTGRATPLPELCRELTAARGTGGHEIRASDLRRSARDRPDLFFLLEPADAAWAAEWADDVRSEYRLALRSAALAEPGLVLLDDEAADAAIPPLPSPSRSLYRLWRSGPTGAAAAVAEAMRDAVALERHLEASAGADADR